MHHRIGLLVGLVMTAACLWAWADTPSKDKGAKTPPYNEKADAKADLQAALQRAKKDNRRVLIQWGGNWCSWCVLLHKRFTEDTALRRKLLYEYDFVAIDIGHRDRNQDLLDQFHVDLKKNGVPYLTILDSDGKAVVNQSTDSFETKEPGGNGHDPKKLLDFLTQHQAKPLVGEDVLRTGLTKAEKTDRLVFVHFGAPWCGWCRRMESWMAQPEITTLLGKEFVDVKIDIDRMEGGKAILERYNPGSKGGIPWFVFLDCQGKALASSDGPKGNIGFPSEDAEIVHFVKMLESHRRHLTRQDIERLEAALKAERKRTKS